MKRQTLIFTAPRQAELREESLPPLGTDQALVQTVCSAISAGTEMLIYRGQFPEGMDDRHDKFTTGLHYPLSCGYACVGRVIEVGSQVDPSLSGRLVFSFQPHSSHFICSANSLIAVPDGRSADAACLLPNVETAVNLVQDGAPILGERVLVLGQGVVGLLAASLLSEFPLAALLAADPLELRRKASPAPSILDPSGPGFMDQARSLLEGGSDLTFELSGSPAALDSAIALTTFTGRIVIGSWYGQKRASLDLGGAFHRSRIHLISSQVSTIAPELSARWDKSRRFGVAWDALGRIRPERWITHRFLFSRLGEAYRLLDESPQDAIQVILEYPLS
ncbi:MAG TPA: zinc-binding alcohol dehydrogenase [Anaerolineales bacterium]